MSAGVGTARGVDGGTSPGRPRDGEPPLDFDDLPTVKSWCYVPVTNTFMVSTGSVPGVLRSHAASIRQVNAAYNMAASKFVKKWMALHDRAIKSSLKEMADQTHGGAVNAIKTGTDNPRGFGDDDDELSGMVILRPVGILKKEPSSVEDTKVILYPNVQGEEVAGLNRESFFQISEIFTERQTSEALSTHETRAHTIRNEIYQTRLTRINITSDGSVRNPEEVRNIFEDILDEEQQARRLSRASQPPASPIDNGEDGSAAGVPPARGTGNSSGNFSTVYTLFKGYLGQVGAPKQYISSNYSAKLWDMSIMKNEWAIDLPARETMQIKGYLAHARDSTTFAALRLDLISSDVHEELAKVFSEGAEQVTDYDQFAFPFEERLHREDTKATNKKIWTLAKWLTLCFYNNEPIEQIDPNERSATTSQREPQPRPRQESSSQGQFTVGGNGGSIFFSTSGRREATSSLDAPPRPPKSKRPRPKVSSPQSGDDDESTFSALPTERESRPDRSVALTARGGSRRDLFTQLDSRGTDPSAAVRSRDGGTVRRTSSQEGQSTLLPKRPIPVSIACQRFWKPILENDSKGLSMDQYPNIMDFFDAPFTTLANLTSEDNGAKKFYQECRQQVTNFTEQLTLNTVSEQDLPWSVPYEPPFIDFSTNDGFVWGSTITPFLLAVNAVPTVLSLYMKNNDTMQTWCNEQKAVIEADDGYTELTSDEDKFSFIRDYVYGNQEDLMGKLGRSRQTQEWDTKNAVLSAIHILTMRLIPGIDISLFEKDRQYRIKLGKAPHTEYEQILTPKRGEDMHKKLATLFWDNFKGNSFKSLVSYTHTNTLLGLHYSNRKALHNGVYAVLFTQSKWFTDNFVLDTLPPTRPLKRVSTEPADASGESSGNEQEIVNLLVPVHGRYPVKKTDQTLLGSLLALLVELAFPTYETARRMNDLIEPYRVQVRGPGMKPMPLWPLTPKG